MKNVIIFGASEQGVVLLDSIEAGGAFECVGFIDDGAIKGDTVAELPILGGIDDIGSILDAGHADSIVIAIGDNFVRQKIHTKLKALYPRLRFPNIIHPSAIISPRANLGEGIVALANSLVGPNATIEDGVLINNGAQIDHDSLAKQFASLSPGAITGGKVVIGECSAIGVGAAINHGITIGDHTVIGSGATVVRDIDSHCVAIGTPTRKLKDRKTGERYL